MKNHMILGTPENILDRFYIKNYGKMCQEWIDNVDLFISWAMKNGYEIGKGVCRIRRDSPYSKDNCYIGELKESDENYVFHAGRYYRLKDICSGKGMSIKWITPKLVKGYSLTNILAEYEKEKTNIVKKNITVQLRINADIWDSILKKSQEQGIKPSQLIENSFK